MNMLIDLLPEYVELGGAEYPINTDFRVSILFELMMEDASVPEEQKAIKAVKLFYPELPPVGLLHEAVKALLWFYQAGKEQKVPKYKTNAEDDESDEAETDDYVERIYSFEHDDDYIYSAFLSQYRIDLQDIEYLHWWKFRAMFRALDEDCQFCKIMSYRSIKINNDMTKSQKAFYRRMKSVHALPVPQEERERIDAITQALLNGGDLMGLI